MKLPFPYTRPAVAVFASLALGASSAVANGIYMDIERKDGSRIEGGSQVSDYKGQIVLTELSQSLWSDNCSCCSASLSASKKPDASSTELYKRALTGENFEQVTIAFVEGQETGEPNKYLEMELKGASIATMDTSFSGNAQWGGRSEHLTIGFSGITWTSWENGKKQTQQWQMPEDQRESECSSAE